MGSWGPGDLRSHEGPKRGSLRILIRGAPILQKLFDQKVELMGVVVLGADCKNPFFQKLIQNLANFSNLLIKWKNWMACSNASDSDS